VNAPPRPSKARVAPTGTRRGGWSLTEAVVSVGILAALIVGFSDVLKAVREVNRRQLVARRCMAAGQAVLDGITATGAELPAADVGRLWPGVHVRVFRRPGRGDWAGLTLVEARARGEANGRPVAVTLRRYVAPAPRGEAAP